MSPLGPNAYEAFVDLFKLHEAREWRAIVKRGDSLVAAVGSSPASIELRSHAEAMCADAMLHDSATIEGLERFAVALAMWPPGVHPEARDRFGSKFVVHASHAGRYDPARNEAERLAKEANPWERSAALRTLATIAWDTDGPLDTIRELLEASYGVEELTPEARLNAERRALFYLCQFHCMAGQGERAWAFGRRLLEFLSVAQGTVPHPPSEQGRWVDRVGALRAAGWAAALAGDTARGRELFEQSEAELVPPSSPRQAALDVARSRVWRSLGEPDEAGSSARQAIAGGERHNLTWPRAAGHRELGQLAIDRNDAPTAIAELEAALELFRVLHNPRDESVTSRLLDAARSGG